MAFNYSPKIVRDSSLVLYLDAANPNSFVSGSTIWNDISKSGNIGVLNGPIYNSGNGGGIQFDGTNDFVLFNNLTAYSNTNAHTYSAWIYSTNFGASYKWIINNGAASTGTSLITRLVSGAGRVGFFYQGGTAVLSSTATLSLNTWQYVTTVYNGSGSVTFYINGVFDKTTSVGAATWTAVNSSPRIGTWFNGSYPFVGNISNVQIYNRALSASEIQQNYNALKGRFGMV